MIRDLLLEFGADESDDDRKRWELRQQADFAERIRIRNEKNIDKNHDPWSGGCEM